MDTPRQVDIKGQWNRPDTHRLALRKSRQAYNPSLDSVGQHLSAFS